MVGLYSTTRGCIATSANVKCVSASMLFTYLLHHGSHAALDSSHANNGANNTYTYWQHVHTVCLHVCLLLFLLFLEGRKTYSGDG